MRPLIAVMLLIAVGATGCSAPAPEAAPRDVEQEALDHMASLTAAYVSNDVEAYMGHYARDLTWWGPGGRGSWDAYNESWGESVATNGGVASAEASDHQVVASGDGAVVSYHLSADYNSADGTTSHSDFQMSATLLMRDGEWKVVHLHFSRAG